MEVIAYAIDNLNGMIPALRNAAPHDMLLDSRYKSILFDVRHDIDRVRTALPKCAEFLTERFGRLNTLRRSIREYGRLYLDASFISNPSQYAPGPGPPSQDRRGEPASVSQPAHTPAPSVFSRTVSTVVPQTLGSTDPSTLQPSIFEIPAARESRDNDESSASSVTSYAATVNPNMHRTIRIPAPPAGALTGKPFDCHICYRRVSGILRSTKWK